MAKSEPRKSPVAGMESPPPAEDRAALERAAQSVKIAGVVFPLDVAAELTARICAGLDGDNRERVAVESLERLVKELVKREAKP